MLMTHPRFRDVVMLITKKRHFVIKVLAKVQWWSKDGKLYFGSETLMIPLSKWREFTRIDI